MRDNTMYGLNSGRYEGLDPFKGGEEAIEIEFEEPDPQFTVICLECGVVGEDPDECEGCGGSDLELA